jgi:hypothetical protein
MNNAISLYEALLVREGWLTVENFSRSEVDAIIAALSWWFALLGYMTDCSQFFICMFVCLCLLAFVYMSLYSEYDLNSNNNDKYDVTVSYVSTSLKNPSENNFNCLQMGQEPWTYPPLLGYTCACKIRRATITSRINLSYVDFTSNYYANRLWNKQRRDCTAPNTLLVLSTTGEVGVELPADEVSLEDWKITMFCKPSCCYHHSTYEQCEDTVHLIRVA